MVGCGGPEHPFLSQGGKAEDKQEQTSLPLADGSSIRGHANVAKEAVSFFQALLNAEETPYPGRHVLNQVVSKSLSQIQILELNQDVSQEEISAAFRSIHPNKSPGPDGLNGHFFKEAWGDIGEEVVAGIKYFFDTGRLLKELNTTAISLIPKVKNPSSLNDFRPFLVATQFTNA